MSSDTFAYNPPPDAVETASDATIVFSDDSAIVTVQPSPNAADPTAATLSGKSAFLVTSSLSSSQKEKLLNFAATHVGLMAHDRNIGVSNLSPPKPGTEKALNIEKLGRFARSKGWSRKQPNIIFLIAGIEKLNEVCQTIADPMWPDDVPNRCLAAGRRLMGSIDVIREYTPYLFKHPLTKKMVDGKRLSPIGAIINIAEFRRAMKDLRLAARHLPYFEDDDPRYQVRAAYLELIRSYLRHGPDRKLLRKGEFVLCFSPPLKPDRPRFLPVHRDQREAFRNRFLIWWSTRSGTQ